MKKIALTIASALALSCFAPGASANNVEVGGRVIAGGGTQLSNGVFFPGTALPRSDGGFDGMEPLQIQRGTDIEFVNLDEASLSNSHEMRSLKRRKGRPLFSSEQLTRPGQTALVVTSNLKPGVYPYYCSVHTGMWGRIEIVR
jgi:plastocyanin